METIEEKADICANALHVVGGNMYSFCIQFDVNKLGKVE